MSAKRCIALTQKGQRCRAAAMVYDYSFENHHYVRKRVDYDYCYNHLWIQYFLSRDVPAFERHTGKKVTIT